METDKEKQELSEAKKSLLETFIIHSKQMNVDDFVGKNLPSDKWAEYQKLRRIEYLHYEAIEKGWDEFTWEKARKSGILCEHDYSIFEELKDCDPLEYFSMEQKNTILNIRKKRSAK